MRAFLAQQCVCLPDKINKLRMKLTQNDDVSETGREGPKLPLEVISDKPSTKTHLLMNCPLKTNFLSTTLCRLVTLNKSFAIQLAGCAHRGSQNESMNFSGKSLCQSASNILPDAESFLSKHVCYSTP